ncbi:hydroxyethylthiazole kinase [Cellulomonas massiliensis]|uniref:hydroxyethylthiazole kinase n=1 Tax=Cellulomonas massiliensis TaxID=1465811 RepID=UPI000308FB89|nr:hydroxyethylthiazole kinase [Cellulomonas massiliensis]
MTRPSSVLPGGHAAPPAPAGPGALVAGPYVRETVAALHRVRAAAPLVQCLTNGVVTNVTANVLLALGAAPAMVDVPGEAGPFAAAASAVLVNLGTPHDEQRSAMRQAATAASEHGTPWVLDPVAVGSLRVRTALASELVALRPSVVRGNASEVLALAGAGAGGRGVDATASVDEARAAARELAGRTGGVVAVSGAVDVVTDGDRLVRVANGDALLTRVTGGGCALGAVVGAFLAVEDDPLVATVAAVVAYTVAAEVAAERAAGPGTFAVHLLDALAGLDEPTLVRRAAVA